MKRTFMPRGMLDLVLNNDSRTYRYPYASRRLNWYVVVGTSVTMVVAISLSIKACLDIFEDKAQSDDYSLWKAGSALVVVVWIFQIGWSIYSLQFHDKGIQGPGYQGGTLVSILHLLDASQVMG